MYNLFLIGQLSYIIRVLAYTFFPSNNIQIAYLILIIEPLHGLTFAGTWIATVEYGVNLVPKEYQAMIQALQTHFLKHPEKKRKKQYAFTEQTFLLS